MFELARFARYALRFERAYKTDDWTAVRRCFHDDARYVIVGGVPPYDGETAGADAIIRLFQAMLNDLDRRFDRRIPKLTAWPRARSGQLTVRWRARYVIGAESAVVTGVSECRFEAGKIRWLEDTLVAAEVEHWVALCERACRPATAVTQA